MLFASLVLSAILLGSIGVVLARGQRPGPGTLLLGCMLSIGPMFVMFQFPCVLLQAVLLLLMHVPATYFRLGAASYFRLALLATAGPYAVVGTLEWASLTALRDEFRYESMEARLPQRHKVTEKASSAQNDRVLAVVEASVGEVQREGMRIWWHDRARNLKTLHESTLTVFVNRPGFGVARMPGIASGESLRRVTERESRMPQPASKPLELISAAAESLEAANNEDRFFWLHTESLSDFVYPEGFGFFKDRRHVAGFRPHQFREYPEKGKQLNLETVELLGLVVHEYPVVYVSDSLPRMDVLRSAVTRPLDVFESQGLAELRRGETLFLRQLAGRLRMLGAIRAAEQCTSCHDCERGELLGAFSYVLDKSSH